MSTPLIQPIQRRAAIPVMRFVICILFLFVAWGAIGLLYERGVYDDNDNNCKHQSIAFHDWLAEHGIDSHYAGERVSPTVGHVWVVVWGVPVETTSLGVVDPRRVGWYLRPDWTFANTEEVLAFR